MQRVYEVVLPVNQADDLAFDLGDPELQPALSDVSAGPIFAEKRLARGSGDIGPPGALEGVAQDRLQGGRIIRSRASDLSIHGRLHRTMLADDAAVAMAQLALAPRPKRRQCPTRRGAGDAIGTPRVMAAAGASAAC
jgi:hypothetical protein